MIWPSTTASSGVFCGIAGEPALAADPRYASNKARVAESRQPDSPRCGASPPGGPPAVGVGPGGGGVPWPDQYPGDVFADPAGRSARSAGPDAACRNRPGAAGRLPDAVVGDAGRIPQGAADDGRRHRFGAVRPARSGCRDDRRSQKPEGDLSQPGDAPAARCSSLASLATGVWAPCWRACGACCGLRRQAGLRPAVPRCHRLAVAQGRPGSGCCCRHPPAGPRGRFDDHRNDPGGYRRHHHRSCSCLADASGWSRRCGCRGRAGSRVR